MRYLIAVTVLASSIAGCTRSSQEATEPAATSPVAKADSEEPRDELKIGDTAPTFEDLIGVDDKRHSLADFADAKAIAVVFTCNHCPVAQAYEDRLVALQDDAGEKGVLFVAINVNNLEQDKLPAMKERASEKGFQFPYLYDPTQKVGRDYGATVTPHVFLLDGRRRLAYVGPVDDNQDESKVANHYLQDAIDAVLVGQAPEHTNVKPVGCGIQYE